MTLDKRNFTKVGDARTYFEYRGNATSAHEHGSWRARLFHARLFTPTGQQVVKEDA
jgi:hypothetical protein